jgi:hypothetical protein
MKSKSFFGASLAALLVTVGASAGTVPLDTGTYNFQLPGGGGGASATLNGVNVEIFCINFDNEIYVPDDYANVDVTKLSTTANLSETRFGGVSDGGISNGPELANVWTTITLNDGNTSLDNTDDAFFNDTGTPGAGSTSLARYEMVAYLVSLYNQSQGATTANTDIQVAIWTLMDPVAEGAAANPSNVNPDSYLEAAAAWYKEFSGNTAAMNLFLSQFQVVSDPNMTFSNGLGAGGFQEQMVMTPTPTPEPRGAVWVVLCVMLGGFLVARRNRTAAGTSVVSLKTEPSATV